MQGVHRRGTSRHIYGLCGAKWQSAWCRSLLQSFCRNSEISRHTLKPGRENPAAWCKSCHYIATNVNVKQLSLSLTINVKVPADFRTLEVPREVPLSLRPGSWIPLSRHPGGRLKPSYHLHISHPDPLQHPAQITIPRGASLSLGRIVIHTPSSPMATSSRLVEWVAALAKIRGLRRFTLIADQHYSWHPGCD